LNKLPAFLALLLILFCTCTSTPVTHIEGTGIGTYYHITIADKNTVTKSQIDSIITELNNTASIFNPHSLVSKINRNETDTLNPILKQLLETALQVCEETEGAFDFTVGALVNLWGFGKEPSQEVTEEEIEKALKTVGYPKIKIEENRIVKENPDTQLNFNAIAKGYCVDLLAAFLSAQGLENFLVDIGGELYVCGKRASNSPWRVGIQKPTETKEGAIAAEEIMELQDIAVATSGNYRNYLESNGKKVGHTINPHTGYPAINRLLSATVMASTCTLADAYATALMVMNETQIQTFISQHIEIKTYLIKEGRKQKANS
jgi:thiamine biosynthesis lipoprotein